MSKLVVKSIVNGIGLAATAVLLVVFMYWLFGLR